MDLDTAGLVELRVVLPDLLGDDVGRVHEFLEGDARHVPNELGARVIAEVAASVASALHHRRKIDDLPEERPLQHQFDVVRSSAIELKGHELGSAVEALDEEVPGLASSALAPAKLDDLVVRLEEEAPGLPRGPLLLAAVEVLELAVASFHDHRFVVCESDELPDFLDGFVRGWDEQLLLRDEPLLTGGLVSDQDGVLSVHLDGLLLATIHSALVGTEEDLLAALAAACFDPDVAARLVQDLDILVDLQVDGHQDFPIQQILIGAREDGLLATMHCDGASNAVDETNVLIGLEGPSCFHSLWALGRDALDAPGGFEVDQGLTFLDPARACGGVLQSNILIFFQCDRFLREELLLVGAWEPNARTLDDVLVGGELILDDEVRSLGEARCYPF
mmetsp:Transcript_19936/g.43347  ORF Transcript_19936/g.43347 Transcript_19936/m.43347 type:complete len:391 (+) Transcript_19936:467-1639(+)